MSPSKQDWSPRRADVARMLAPYVERRIEQSIKAVREATGFDGRPEDFPAWASAKMFPDHVQTVMAYNVGYLDSMHGLIEEYEIQVPEGLRKSAWLYMG